MARWEANARERLERAALELFTERGYEAVTVGEIAERARLTKASYFRHFPDKREVLFWGQGILVELFTTAIAQAPPEATPLEMMARALEAVADAFPPERHELAALREAVIKQSADLQERLAYKQMVLTSAAADALRARGTTDPVAVLAAHLGSLAFSAAYQQWAATPSGEGFERLAHEALNRLSGAAAQLGDG